MMVWAIAATRNASVPGRMRTCSSATSAVRVRRGSTTTRRPPRVFRARSRAGISGAVHRDPFETIGFAPRMSMKSVRSMSGIGIDRPVPNISPAATWVGIWSTVLAVKTFRVPSARMRAGAYSVVDELCTFGLPRNRPMALLPCTSRTGRSRRSISAHACGQVARWWTPSAPRMSGYRSRDGSLWNSPRAMPLGHT